MEITTDTDCLIWYCIGCSVGCIRFLRRLIESLNLKFKDWITTFTIIIPKVFLKLA